MDEGLFKLFTGATYNVEGLGDLFVGAPLPKPIIQWMRVHGASTFIMVGAENPQGQKVADDVNMRAHAALLKDCNDSHYTWLPATGRGENWYEHGVAIFGIAREGAIELMHKYDQAAVLFAEIDGAVELIE